MNKLLVLFVAVLTMLATGCSNELAPEMPKEENVPTVKGKVRSADEAAGIALKAKGKVSGKESRSTYGVKSVECVGVPSSRSEASTDSLFYIVNFDDNEGYAIVGADRRVDDVLAVIDEGSFDSNDIEPNSPRELMYNLVQDFALTQVSVGPPVVIDPVPYQYCDIYSDTTYLETEKMLWIAWSEKGIYAKYADSLYPHSIAESKRKIGCGPLAVGMVMSYFQYPQQITITYDGSNRIFTPDWDIMNEYGLGAGMSTFWFNGEQEIAEEHIPLLLRELAERLNAEGEPLTGDVLIDISNIPVALSQFGYTCQEVTGLDNNNKLILLPSRNDNRMIICSASQESDVVSILNPELPFKDHIFIFDGYSKLFIRKGVRIYEINGSIWTLLSDTVESETEKSFVHINWGWGGTDNGYYNVEMFLQTTDRYLDRKTPGDYRPFNMYDLHFYSVTR